MTDTVFALATPPGRGAIAVVRLTGPNVRSALKSLGVGAVKARRASLRVIRDGRDEAIDHAIVLWFPGPRSYTGEDSAELQVHGGAAVVDGVMAALADAGLRLAAPGEFTRRAFENGKLDLGQAEAVADLIDAESAAQARQAVRQLDGALSLRYRQWRDRLVVVLTHLEAAVDFPEEDIPEAVAAGARGPLEVMLGDLDAALVDGARGRRIRDGYRVAIVGAPNAGKSSLFNYLVEREAAIVTPLAGTTRDVIEASLLLDGYRVLMADMAGIRSTEDCIEGEGVRRARLWAEAADLRLWVVDQSAEDEGWREGVDLLRSGDLCVLNKVDLPAGGAAAAASAVAEPLGLETLKSDLSVGQKACRVREWLADRVTGDLRGADFPATTRLRHTAQLSAARSHLQRALSVLDQPELAAEDVRLAARALAVVTGEIGVEDVLDGVFATFCIGK